MCSHLLGWGLHLVHERVKLDLWGCGLVGGRSFLWHAQPSLQLGDCLLQIPHLWQVLFLYLQAGNLDDKLAVVSTSPAGGPGAKLLARGFSMFSQAPIMSRRVTVVPFSW